MQEENNFRGNSLSGRDKAHLWHPLTQHKLSPDLLAIVKAKGAILYDEGGKEYIDGIASWYTSMYGHCHPYIIDKITLQMQQLDHVIFSGFTHEPAVKLSEALIRILPGNQQKLFFSDNGSTATEVGIKMALQYHYNRGNDRKVMLAFEEGFHGDTFGAMSVSGLSVYNGAFEDHFIEVTRIPVPTGKNNEDVIKSLKDKIAGSNIAGFIYEPLVQGAAAMKMHDPAGLDEILKLCKENEILCIADEVMTGFGKTGKNFASEYIPTKPDIICLSKALTAGVLPMAVTSCTQEIYDAFYSDDISKGLFHGHTYTANPLACTAALSGIELLISEEIQQDVQRVMNLQATFLKKLKGHQKVKNLRQLGVILAFELDVHMERYGNMRDRLFKFFMERGVFLRPLGNTIYILPPFVITNDQLAKIHDSIEEALQEF
ncbi:adenosylmethionine--8-amino-7-oxononanoate transaminase [Antarcticibacterium flavum]|uniref:Adenosylmethionine-8-amino-7-oxononanoate aminotransferase n=1 Tax=Antarcticibacterium flavum TaxID=2058175 RepID=A0A5B7X4Y2_9FLAO|nr:MULTISPECIES: adenosylmethionine--8-amino-7-oxononanoate transaminase [Antarcticibacterium]MCM4160525.1 adenosylmethionine--8-amino-7-oxononanoate transaminase [Antarcticibacterium sp. W02-3]QCY69811.1 adenosylmethionine--8-amino-7-oxononanoate transaminase [Antarcticibacterium flavum]